MNILLLNRSIFIPPEILKIIFNYRRKQMLYRVYHLRLIHPTIKKKSKHLLPITFIRSICKYKKYCFYNNFCIYCFDRTYCRNSRNTLHHTPFNIFCQVCFYFNIDLYCHCTKMIKTWRFNKQKYLESST